MRGRRGSTLGAIALAWTDRRIRLAILGYVGHMWELYAFWAWVGVIAGTSYAAAGVESAWAAKLTAFLAIALGGLACVPAGRWGDRFGKARVAAGAMVLSGDGGARRGAGMGRPALARRPRARRCGASPSCRTRRSSRRWSPTMRRPSAPGR